MKYYISLIFFVAAYFSIHAQVFTSSANQSQIADPIEWDARLEKQNDSIYTLIFQAKLDKGWHLYSQDVDEDGPIPTTFTYNDSPETYELIGPTEEPDVPAIYDEVFQMDIKFFKNEATFTQQIKVFDPNAIIEAEVEFMVCDDEQCLPPDVAPFQFSVNQNTAIQGYSNVDVSALDVQRTNELNIGLQGWEQYKPKQEEGSGYWTIFFLGFIGGLIALLTPCVFPMIPLTVSFFTKGAKTRKKGLVNAILYGVFIFLIYLLLSIPFHLLDSVAPEILNNISTNTTLNIVFFIIFIVFAFPFLAIMKSPFLPPGAIRWMTKLQVLGEGSEYFSWRLLWP
jgi:thiol:disulfide interchange protein